MNQARNRIDVAAEFIARTPISKVAVCSAREYGKTPVEKFCELTGAMPLLERFMPGTFTNPLLPNYMEPELIFVTDPQADQQAVIEATRAGLPVIGIANSDNAKKISAVVAIENTISSNTEENKVPNIRINNNSCIPIHGVEM